MGVHPRKKKISVIRDTRSWEEAPWLEGAAEDIRASRKSKDTEDPVDVMLYDPFAIRLTHVFIRAGVPANAVTLMSLFAGIGGAILLYPQNRWINLLGIFVIIFAAILDCSDGQIARLTHTSSQLGRFLDGLVDITNYAAIYLVLGFRMMKETIPFTQTPWSFYIWFVILVTMICHAGQARLADYYRGLHLYFLEGSNKSYLARSKNLKTELKSLPKNSPLYERIYRFLYLIYTKAQELYTPKAQRLLDAMEEHQGPAAEKASLAYVGRSRRNMVFVNILTYNIRTFALFIMLMLKIQAFFFPFVIIVLETVKYVMVVKYERIAQDVCRCFPAGADAGTGGGESGQE